MRDLTMARARSLKSVCYSLLVNSTAIKIPLYKTFHVVFARNRIILLSLNIFYHNEDNYPVKDRFLRASFPEKSEH